MCTFLWAGTRIHHQFGQFRAQKFALPGVLYRPCGYQCGVHWPACGCCVAGDQGVWSLHSAQFRSVEQESSRHGALALLGLLLALSTLCFITPRWVIRRKGFSQIDCSRMQSGPCAFWLLIPLSQSSNVPGLEYISGTLPRCMRWLQ